MDASSKLKPGLIKNQCSEAIREAQADNQDLEIMKQKIADFVGETEIKSNKFNNMKLQLSDYQLIIDSMIAANDANITDYQTLSEAVGDEDLDGAVIIADKTNAEQAQASATQAAYNARDMANYWRPVSIMQAMEWDRLALGYDQEASNWQDMINLYQIKMDFYDRVESSTAGLFASGSAIQAKVTSAMGGVTGAFQGGKYVYNEKAAWRSDLEELTSYYVDVEEGDPLLDFVLGDGRSITRLGIDEYTAVNKLKNGIVFDIKKVNGKYRIFMKGGKVTGKNKMTMAQIQSYLKKNIKNVDWDKYDVKKMMKDGVELKSKRATKYFGGLDKSSDPSVKELGKTVKTVSESGKIGNAGRVFKKTFKEGFDPLRNVKGFKTAKVSKSLGLVGDVITVGSNFNEQFIEDGELTVSADRVQDFVTDTAIDFGSSSAATAAGFAIGSLFGPAGSVVGLAAGFVIDTAINWDAHDFDGDGEKDSLVDGAKMGLDQFLDDTGKWLSETFW